MIDEKKIEEAAEDIYEEQFSGYHQYFVSEEDHSPLFEEHDIRYAVTLGIKWAQQEFIKSLWHDASEEPSPERLLILHESKYIQPYNWKMQIDDPTFKNVAKRCGESYWAYYARHLLIEKWCYVRDILPKEGGEE